MMLDTVDVIACAQTPVASLLALLSESVASKPQAEGNYGFNFVYSLYVDTVKDYGNRKFYFELGVPSYNITESYNDN